MKEIKITTENFENEVLKSEKPVLLDFWATWCGPCMMIAPELSQFAAEHPEIKVGKINVDEEPSLAELFKINSIPTLFLIENGVATKGAMGAMTKAEIEKKFTPTK